MEFYDLSSSLGEGSFSVEQTDPWIAKIDRKDLLTTTDAAKLSGVAVNTIIRHCNERILPHTLVPQSNHRRIKKPDLSNWCKAQDLPCKLDSQQRIPREVLILLQTKQASLCREADEISKRLQQVKLIVEKLLQQVSDHTRITVHPNGLTWDLGEWIVERTRLSILVEHLSNMSPAGIQSRIGAILGNQNVTAEYFSIGIMKDALKRMLLLEGY